MIFDSWYLIVFIFPDRQCHQDIQSSAVAGQQAQQRQHQQQQLPESDYHKRWRLQSGQQP